MISKINHRGAGGGKGIKTPTRTRRKIGLLSLEQDTNQQNGETVGLPEISMTDAAVISGNDAEKGGIPTSIDIRTTSKKKDSKLPPNEQQKQDHNLSKTSLFSDEIDEAGEDQVEPGGGQKQTSGSQHSRVSTQSIILQLQRTLQKAKREVTKLRLRLRNKTQERDEFKLQAKQTAEMLTMMREQNVKLLKERESFIENISQLKAERDKYHNQVRDKNDKMKELKRELSFAKLKIKMAGVERPISRSSKRKDLIRDRILLQDHDLFDDVDDGFSNSDSSTSSDGEPYDLKFKNGGQPTKLRHPAKGGDVSFLPAATRKIERYRTPSKDWKDIGLENRGCTERKVTRTDAVKADSSNSRQKRSSNSVKRGSKSPQARAA
jgi:hypothetical protein